MLNTCFQYIPYTCSSQKKYACSLIFPKHTEFKQCF
uniref:Uncharacterized protein n=1 Tax=Anguilla anguilla TaxID=7936 RepID=A0A0E9SGD3_ANGAN